MQLSSEQVAPYLSRYLMGGWREDELQLVAVEVERDRITGTVDVVRSFAAGDGQFHLTVPHTDTSHCLLLFDWRPARRHGLPVGDQPAFVRCTRFP